MGNCCASRKKMNPALARSEYRLNALGDLMSLVRAPHSLDPETDTDGFISTHLFHNLYYNGFYAPYICNPTYMLIVDCRSESEFNQQHVMMSRWRGRISRPQEGSNAFCYVILYDDQSTDWEGASEKLKMTYNTLKANALEPLCVIGGFLHLESRFPYMFTSKVLTINRFRNKYLQWYPSWVSVSLLLGRTDQANNPNVVYDMRVTHVVSLLPVCKSRVFSHISYLTVPLEDCHEQDVLAVLPRIFEFITDATEAGGRVLIHCDQGVNRAAVVTLAYLMASHGCTLEDAFYHLESLRPTIQPAFYFLKQLTKYEQQIFGKKLSNIDDLEF